MLGLGLSLPEIALRSARGGGGTPASALDLDFLSMVDGGVRLTRSSPAYGTDGYGVFRRYPENTPRYSFDATTGEATPLVESATTNLFKDPDLFAASTWAKSNTVITPNAAICPTGEMLADKMIETSANAGHSVGQTPVVTAGVTLTFSVFAKAAEREILQMNLSGASTTAFLRFNLTTGLFVQVANINTGTDFSNPTGSATALSNGWYRVRLTVTTTTATTANCSIFHYNGAASTYLGDGTSGFFIWGAQLEYGQMSSYTPGTRAADALSDPARARTLKRTNMLQRSAEFDQAPWTVTRASIVPNATTDPFGGTAAEKLVEDASVTNSHFVSQPSVAVTAGNYYTFSVYAKAAERNFVQFTFNNTTFGSARGTVDLTTGAVQNNAASTTTTATAAGNGWWRVSMTAQCITSGANSFSSLSAVLTITGSVNYTGDGTSGLYIFGSQFEVGQTATAYIPTTTAAVTTTDIDYRLSLTRWGSATGINAYGQVATYAPNVPRFDPTTGDLIREAAETNLLLNSGSQSSWGTTAASRTINAGTAPDGTETASRWVATGAVNTSPGIGSAVTPNAPYTFSVHYKQESGSTWVRFRLDAGGTIRSVFFNTATGAVGTVNSLTGTVTAFSAVPATALANGWWRFGLAFTTTSSSVSLSVAPAITDNSTTMTVGDSWLMWGAQLELNGLTSYIPTTAATVTRAADTITAPNYTLDSRATYTGPTISWQGDLSGRLVTTPHNLLAASQDFSASSWSKTATGTASAPVVTGSVGQAPDGTWTADRVVLNLNGGTASTDRCDLAQALTSVVGATYTFSVWMRTEDGSTKAVRIDFGGVGPTLCSVTGTWTRFTTTYTATLSTNYPYIRLRGGQSTADSATVLVWGAQVEQHPFARPYRNSSVRNLLGFTESLDNAAWTKNFSTVQANVAANPVNGAIDADKLTPNATTNSFFEARQDAALLLGVTYTFSSYVKAAGYNFVSIAGTGTIFGPFHVNFDLSTGTESFFFGGTSTVVGRGITAVGGGWYRIWAAVTTQLAGSGRMAVTIIPAGTSARGASWTPSGTDGVLQWGAELSSSGSLDAYSPTYGSAPSASAWYGPVFDFDASGTPAGLRIEEGRTNSIVNNTMVGAVAGTPGTLPTTWTFPAVVAGLTRSVIGTGTINGIPYIDIQFSGTVAAGDTTLFLNSATAAATVTATTWTSSLYVALVGGSVTNCTFRLGHRFRDSGGANLGQNYETVFVPTATLTRVATTGTGADAAIGYVVGSLVLNTVASTIDVTLRVGLPQLELGAFATSPIFTYGSATATRAVDVVTVPNIQPWYRADEGTLSVEFDLTKAPPPVTQYPVCLDDGTNNTLLTTYVDSVSQIIGYLQTSGVGQMQPILAASATSGTVYRTALGYRANDSAGSANGSAPVTDTANTIGTYSRMLLGNRFDGLRQFTGHVRKVGYYRQRLDNATLQSITT